MAKSQFEFKVRDKLSDQLASAADVQPELIPELNAIVDDVYKLARGRMNAGINLSDDYLRRHMAVTHATPSRGFSAEITAYGGPSHNTPLGRYLKGVASRPAPGAKGNSRGPTRTGVGQGRKAAGVEVEVGRGRNVTLLNGFVLPLRKGTEAGGNGLGVFLRTKYGLIRHRYGPSPYQLFRVAAGDLEDSVGETTAERLADVAQRALMDKLK